MHDIRGGNEISPKKVQMRVEAQSVVLPDAAIHTTMGNTTMMHTASNTQLRLHTLPPGIYGTKNKANNTTVHNQNAPRIFMGLNTRDIKMPIVNGHIMRSKPPTALVVSMVQPTPIDP